MDLRYYSERPETKFPVLARTEGCQSNQVWFTRTEQDCEEGDTGIVGETSHRKSTLLPSRERILLDLLHGAQKGRRIPTHFKFETPQFPSESPSLQNGDFSVNSTGIEGRGLGIDPRSKGCLFSRPYFFKPPEISEICVRGDTLPVPRTTLWNRGSTKNIYKNISRTRRFLSQPTGTHIHVPGRLVGQKPGARNIMCSKGADIGDVGDGGTYPEQGEITPYTHSRGCLSRSGVRPEVRNDFPLRGEIFEHGQTDKPSYTIGEVRSPKISEASGVNVVFYGINPQSPSPDETNPVPSHELVECGPGYVEENGAGNSRPSASPKLVEEEGQFFQRCALNTDTRCNIVDRRIGRGLGCALGLPSSERGLDPGTEEEPHKLVRTESGSSGAYQFSPTGEREECTNSYGQFDSSRLYQQRGRHKIASSLSTDVGNFQLGGRVQDKSKSSPHTREEKYHCGRSVKESEAPQFDRVGARQESSGKDFSNFRRTKHRPVRYAGEQAVNSILFPSTHGRSMAHRCLDGKLGKNVRLCLSASDITTPSIAESTAGTLHPNSHCSADPYTIVVPSSPRAGYRFSQTSSRNTESTVAKEGSNFTPRPGYVKACSVEDFGSKRGDQYLSEKAQKYILESRRPSTRNLYGARQRIYISWCRERQINPGSASLNNVAEFIIFLHEVKKCKASTLAGYRSAINEIHAGWKNSSVGTDKILSKLVKGIFNSNPITQQLLPSWDLPLVLETLSKPPFEPLRSVELKFLTWKTVFLIALASASRISELHALSTNQACLRQEPSGFRLLPKFNFLAKKQRMRKAWSAWFIPDFRKCSRNAKDLILCPCRCLKNYLERTKSLRGDIEALFITYKKGQIKPASKDTIARWILCTIKRAYETKDLPFPKDSRAHDTRKLSVSWALFNGATLEEILKAAHWTSESTFTSFYLKDVSSNEGNFARTSILGPIKDRTET